MDGKEEEINCLVFVRVLLCSRPSFDCECVIRSLFWGTICGCKDLAGRLCLRSIQITGWFFCQPGGSVILFCYYDRFQVYVQLNFKTPTDEAKGGMKGAGAAAADGMIIIIC